MCLIETWSTEYSTPTFIAATPKTHYFINYSRASRAGGVAAIIHNSITLHKQTNSTINSIELSHIQLTHKLAYLFTDLNIILLYRPPNSTSPLNTIYNILNNVHDKNNLLILGDFNLNPNSLIFKNILNDLNLKQHIIDPTHSKGNNLDLVITRNSQNKIHTNVGPIITVHNIINIYLNLIKPKQIIKYITYRKLHNIDILEYSNDLHKLTIVDYDNTDATAKHIQEHFTTILDTNAPFKTSKVHLRSTNAWCNNELSVLHIIIRKKELILRKNKNIINYNDYMYHRKKYFKEIKITKQNCFRKK